MIGIDDHWLQVTIGFHKAKELSIQYTFWSPRL